MTSHDLHRDLKDVVGPFYVGSWRAIICFIIRVIVSLYGQRKIKFVGLWMLLTVACYMETKPKSFNFVKKQEDK